MSFIKKTSAITLAAAALFAASSATFVQHASAEQKQARCVGANACKGQSACKTATSSCKGQNACKGQGFVFATDEKTCKDAGGTYES
jgi:hypothetical protein